MAKSYVKSPTPKEIVDKLASISSIAKDTGRIRKGVNEATKSIESGKALIVVLAEDVDPEELVMHIPLLCEEKGVAIAFFPTKADLGKSVGLNVSCAAVAIEDAGGAKDMLNDVIARLGGKPKAEKKEKVEEKPVKKEEKAEAKKEKPRKAKKEKKE
jgi:large subunit ribosomal protein L7Ae